MNIKLSHIVFVFMVDSKKLTVMFEPRTKPQKPEAGISYTYRATVHDQDGKEVDARKTDMFANKSNALLILKQYLELPF